MGPEAEGVPLVPHVVPRSPKSEVVLAELIEIK
jgi:hypothetical protein